MEYRDDLAGVLLSGLPNDERDHVIDVIAHEEAEKLRRKRPPLGAENHTADEEAAESKPA